MVQIAPNIVLYYYAHGGGVPMISPRSLTSDRLAINNWDILSFLTCNLETLFETIFKHNLFITAYTNIWLILSQDQKTNTVELALFNVTADPTERHDISHKYPDVVRRLRERIHEHQRTAVPPGIVPEDVMALTVAMKNKAWLPWRDTCNAKWRTRAFFQWLQRPKACVVRFIMTKPNIPEQQRGMGKARGSFTRSPLSLGDDAHQAFCLFRPRKKQKPDNPG